MELQLQPQLQWLYQQYPSFHVVNKVCFLPEKPKFNSIRVNENIVEVLNIRTETSMIQKYDKNVEQRKTSI